MRRGRFGELMLANGDLLGAVFLAAAAPMSAAPAAPTLASLPSEVLECVLAFLPLRPRLRIASLVARRWRAAALRSVAAVSVLPPGIALLDKFFALFPNLTAVDLRPPAMIIWWSLTLSRSLHASLACQLHCAMTFTSPQPGL